MKRYRIREQMNGIAEPPGKVWFWELEAGVIHADRCIQCGTCVAVCPSNSIGVNEDTDLPELVKMCTGCSLCWDFCPRGGLRYEALWPPSTAVSGEDAEVQPAQVRSDSSDTYWKISGGPPAEGLGAVVESYAVRAGAEIDDAQDGGAVERAVDRPAGRRARSTARSSPSRRPIPTSSGRASPPSPRRRARSRLRPAASTTRRWRWPSWISRAMRCPRSRGLRWWARLARYRDCGLCRPGVGRLVPIEWMQSC